ncbi:hypothetical protein [Shouchella shacheensis]|uniref:hypothetical protein n=1 Tax=Shouchella shacheensis TaxID=1649580 RepID=UPI00073FD83E|nr:hypothetical protein [Shouchella shacheensis]
MLIGGPFLVAIVPGAFVLVLTWSFRKLNFPLSLRLLPGILTVVAAVILFYIGYVEIRGFEGGAYALLAFFLIGFAVLSFVIANKKNHDES